MQPREIKDFQDEIQTVYGCKSSYCRTVHIREPVEGGSVWDGFVKVFDLFGHPDAECCYAWSRRVGSQLKITLVLNSPPVDSPESAVRSALAGGEAAKTSIKKEKPSLPLA